MRLLRIHFNTASLRQQQQEKKEQFWDYDDD